MGALSSSLLHLSFSNHKLMQFPLALMQVVALEHLDASGNEFVEVPAAITALSRLTELTLGRAVSRADPLQLHAKLSLDMRALGDLSGLPALCKLTSDCCEVMLCESVLGAMQHASLTSLCFSVANPAPMCAAVVLQLSQLLRHLGRGGVLKLLEREIVVDHWAAVDAQGQAPFAMFKAALQAC